MIADQERKSISDGNKKRALAIPEAPWKWFTSYELGFPLLADEQKRPMHPLVEVFVDDQLEAYWSEAEEDTVPLPPLIGRLQTIKEGLGDQGCAELPTLVDRATTRERFSTSHIARNPMKLPEIVLERRGFLFHDPEPHGGEGGENPYGPCKSRHLVWRHYGEHLPGGSHPDHLGWPTRNGRSALAPPLKSF